MTGVVCYLICQERAVKNKITPITSVVLGVFTWYTLKGFLSGAVYFQTNVHLFFLFLLKVELNIIYHNDISDKNHQDNTSILSF